MKRIILSVLLAALACGLSAFEFFYVGDRADSYIARIQAADALLRQHDIAAAARACRAVERDWERETAKFHALLIHDYADSIGSSIAKMRVHAEHGNLNQYFAESTEAKKGLASIKGSEYPLLENIL